MAGIKVFLDDPDRPKARKLFWVSAPGAYFPSEWVVVAWDKGEARRKVERVLPERFWRDESVWGVMEITTDEPVMLDSGDG